MGTSRIGKFMIICLIMGLCSSVQAKTVKVPGDLPTIQQAIDAAVNGDTVLVAEGTYKGVGNKDLDFKGKSINVKSESGAAQTIIDCEGVGRGFYFHSGETSESVVSGFTIKNGSPGGNLVQIALSTSGVKSVSPDVRKDLSRPMNDGDPAVEPGEIMGLDITLRNKTLRSIESIKATLKTEDKRVKGMIPVYTGTRITSWNTVDMAETGIPVNYGILMGNTTRTMFFQFVKISDGFVPLGDRVRFTLEMQSGNTFVGSDEFYVKIGADIVLDNIDVDDSLIPGGSPGDIDLRIKNTTQSTISNVEIEIDPESRGVRIPIDEVEFAEILSGRTKTAHFETTIDSGFADYADFVVEIKANNKLANRESFRHYFGMRTQYTNYWVTNDNNNNGIVEPGESIDLQIARRNLTEMEARNVEVTLSTADTLVNITRAIGDYRNIPAYEVSEARRSYQFTVANASAFASIPNFSKQGYAVQFTLSVKEDGELMGTEKFTMRIGGMIRYVRPKGYDEMMASMSDSTVLGANNNGNGVPEPGEVIEMDVTLINVSSTNIASIEGKLDSKDDVRFVIDYGSYDEIRRNGKTGSYKFAFKIDDDFESSRIAFDLTIKAKFSGVKESLGVDVFTVPVFKTGLRNTELKASIVSGQIPASTLQTEGYGGAIHCVNFSSPTISYNIISNNSAISGGGGIYCGSGSTPVILNNVIYGNSAGTYGGGVSCNDGSSATLINNTITGNSASTNGAGISCRNSSFPKVLNTILWGNGSIEIYTDSISGIDITYSDVRNGWSGTGNINANPLFVSVLNNDYHLLDDSPCIAAGIMAQIVPVKDMDGKTRPEPATTQPDIGAYESLLPVVPKTIADVEPSSVDQGATSKEIKVTGTGFQNGAKVSFSGSGITVKSTTFVSSTELKALIDVPAAAPAEVSNVIVTNPDGQMIIKENAFKVKANEATVIGISMPQTANMGESFSAAINVQNVTDLAGLQLNLSFNPGVLEAVSVTEGGFLKTGSTTYWFPPVIDNTAGKITGIVSARTGQGGVNGSGVVAEITFKAKGSGISQVKMENVALSDSKGKSIQVTIQDGSVQIGGAVPWDVNKDGKVDVTDLVIVAQNYGKTIKSPVDPNPDVNGDGIVDIGDIVMVGQHYGEVYGTMSPAYADVWSVDPVYLPTLTRIYNIMEASKSSDPRFVNTKRLLEKLISSVKIRRTELLQNYPNPFNPETWIPFKLAEGSDVEIRIYNLSGKMVRRLELGYRDAGYYTSQANSVKWDGTDENGEKVASGVYFYTIRAGEYSATRKMLLMK